MAPQEFKNLGKNVKDFLGSKTFSFDSTAKTKTKHALPVDGVLSSEITGSVSAKDTPSKIKVTHQHPSGSVAEVTSDSLGHTEASFKTPVDADRTMFVKVKGDEQFNAAAEFYYYHDKITVTAQADTTANDGKKFAKLSAVTNLDERGDLAAGAEVSVDLDTSEVTDYNATVEYRTGANIVTAATKNRGDTVQVSAFRVEPSLDNAELFAQANYNIPNGETSAVFGIHYAVPATSLDRGDVWVKADTKGAVAVAVGTKVSRDISAKFTTEYNTSGTAPTVPTRYGVSFVFGQ